MNDSEKVLALVSANAKSPFHELSGRALREESILLRIALAAMPVGFCMFDKHDRLQLCNQRYLEVWDLPDHLGTRGTHFDVIMAASRGQELVVEGGSPLGTTGQRRREFLTESGKRIEVHVHLLADGIVVALHEDVTARRKDEARIAYLAKHDTLTTLGNRAALQELLSNVLDNEHKDSVALIYIDLDRFKQINDNLGHLAGDQLLRMVAQRLRACTRESDFVARLGGDEFAIVMINSSLPDSADMLSSRIVESLCKPFELEDRQVNIGASIGISISPRDGSSPEELFRKADMALYQAKSAGKCGFCFYEPWIESNALVRRTLELELISADCKRDFKQDISEVNHF